MAKARPPVTPVPIPGPVVPGAGPVEAATGIEPWPKRPARLAQAVVATLVDRIVGGTLPSGSTLPPEPLLCASFGVSRTVVREAVKLLEEKGLARAKQGQGTTITADDEWNLLDPLVLAATVRHDDQLRVLDQLIDVRRVLEAQMAREAAAVATAADLAEIGSLLDQLSAQTTDPGRYVLTDVAYHDRIMKASGNRLGHAIVRTVHAEARNSELYVGQPDSLSCEASNTGHKAIYNRLLARDPDGAAEAMSAHIGGAWQRRRKPLPGRR